MNDDVVIPPVPEDYTFDPTKVATPSTPPSGTPIPSPQVEYINNNINAGAVPSTTVPVAPSIPPTPQTPPGGSGMMVEAPTPLITTDALGNFTLMGIIETLIAYAFIVAGALAAAFIFIGGISFILSGGNDEKIKQAINTIRYSIIGLIVTLLSFTFVIIVGRVFGLDFMKYLSFEKIRHDISVIVAPMQNNQPKTFEVQQ